MTALYSIDFTLPGLPKSQTNNWTKWARIKDKKRWVQEVWAATHGKLPKEPLKSARVHFTRCSATEPDFTNLVASFKHIEDALIEVGLIFDDAPECIGRPGYAWQKVPPKEGRVRVRVDELGA